jgi:hypothetical protein
MTTLWKPSGEWAGQRRVAVVSPAANISAVDADRVIVVNAAASLLPDADMLVALDARRYWPREWIEFAGMRVTGCADPELDALYIGHRCERVRVGRANLEVTNSGLAAIRIAAGMGAREIVLHGFRPNDAQPAEAYVGVAEGLAQIVAELTAAGIVVTFADAYVRTDPPPRRRRIDYETKD